MAISQHCQVHALPHTVSSGMKVTPEVAEAVSTGMPVVALETTIVTHGMPYPANLQYVLF